jgi:hypothetical protein
MKLKIVNETSSAHATKVLTESGEDIGRYIKKMTLHFVAGEAVTADVELVNITIEAFAELNKITVDIEKAQVRRE